MMMMIFVIIANDLKWRRVVDRIVGKTNRILGMPKRTFESREPRLWKDIYISLVWSDLEYAVQAWNPYLYGDIDKIERVQRRPPEFQLVLSNFNMRTGLRD